MTLVWTLRGLDHVELRLDVLERHHPALPKIKALIACLLQKGVIHVDRAGQLVVKVSAVVEQIAIVVGGV